MDVESNGNGEIRFGDAPGNVLNPDTAAKLLRLLHDKAPEDFGYWAGWALAGVPPKTRRGQS
jgi:hypothetical protein